jgi:NTP pyrophosphatase (non-canonical NTP hydrolase)
MSDEHTKTGEIRSKTQMLLAVDDFMNDMIRKLVANEDKGHWSEVTQWYLLSRLNDELTELSDAMIKGAAIKPVSDANKLSQAIIDECADVSNFCMFIADNERKRMEVSNVDGN